MRGNAHKYGKNVDTDVIIPGKYCNIIDPAELGKHALEGLVDRGQAAEAFDDGARLLARLGLAEQEDDLVRRARRQLDHGLKGDAGVEPRAGAIRERRAAQRGGARGTAVAP